MKNNLKFQRAFTLMEALLVMTMMVVISAALYQALSNGLRVWERSRKPSVEEDIMMFFDRLTMDLHNAFNFSLFKFEGESDRIVFSSLVHVPMAKSGSDDVVVYIDQVGRVEYGFDAAAQALYRRDANYGQAVKGKFGPKTILARPVNGMSMRYLERGDQIRSEKKLDRTELPASIEVSIDYIDGQGQTQKIARMINLPLFL